MSVIAQRRLSPEFASLYRLFLRSLSASVLHQPRAIRCLREIWRPTFREAAQAMAGAGSKLTGKQWTEENMHLWDRRIDETLSLLHESAQSRGLPHNVLKNLNMIVGTRPEKGYRGLPRWKGQMAPDQYEPQPTSAKVLKKNSQQEEIDRNAWRSLKEVMQMAEARDGIIFGKLPTHR